MLDHRKTSNVRASWDSGTSVKIDANIIIINSLHCPTLCPTV